MIYRITKRGGRKYAHLVKDRKELMDLRTSHENLLNLEKARSGDEKAKMELLQLAYNLGHVKDVLAGCKSIGSFFFHDIDCYSQEQSDAYKELIMSKREEIGLKMLERSASGGWHLVCKRVHGTTILENQVRVALALRIEMDTNAHDLQRVVFSTSGTTDDLVYLDDELFTEPMTPEECEAEYAELKEREQQGLEEVPEEAKKSNKHYCPWANDKVDSSRLIVDSQLNKSRVESGGDGVYEKYGQKWFLVEQSQGLFEEKNKVYGDEELMYKGKDLRQISLAWFAQRGGMPDEGDRNQGLFELACDMRYIVEFDAEKLLACMPAILDKAEVKKCAKSAIIRERQTSIPNRLKAVLKSLTAEKKEEEEEEKKTNIYELLQKSTDILPASQLPPIFREFVAIAPEDFKKATVVALLPMLGTLGSRLRATYLDGVVQTPSFQAEIEAPMASGKSFANRVDEVVMGDVRKQDAVYRKKEQAYQKKVKAAINKKEQPEVETYPIRIINPTTSVAALLERQMNVGEVHLYSFTDEIKVVLDSMKRGSYGDLRALMRNAFDNQYFGQDYKGDKSTNTMCRIYFNTLHCGTPAEYKKFYDNSEDGTISRILFAELPDQSFKEMPRFKPLTDKQKECIEKGVKRLTEVTIKDDQIQPECELQDFGFVNDWAEKWLTRMRLLAKAENNRSLDTFRRRAAVVGFRAAMIAWFLYDKNTKQNKAKTVAFAEMIAEQMLVSLLHRFKVSEVSNVIYFKNIWNMMNEQFTSSEVDQSAEAVGAKTPAKHIISRWKEQNLVEKIDKNVFRKKKI